MSVTCEYLKAEEHPCGQPIDDTDFVFCAAHREFPWSVCKGCGGQGLRECPHPDSEGVLCREPLCGICIHQGTGHTNDPVIMRPDDYTTTKQVSALRQDMLSNIRATLHHAVDNQVPVDQTAELILEALQLHLLVTVFSGMAMAPK